MNNLEYKSFIIWGAIFLFIEIVLVFSYFNFLHKEIDIRDQLAQIFTTKTEQSNEFPTLKQNVGEFALSAESFISVSVASDSREKILIEKNKDEQLPIASITKLMTALIASEKYKLDDIVIISKNSLKIDGLSGIYQAGDRFYFYNALRAMLIASHNEIANTFAEQMSNNEFINLMNQRASELKLLNTKFVNETGLDPVRSPILKVLADAEERLTSNGVDSEIDGNLINQSTAFDIYKLAKYITENRPDIFYITTQKEFDLFDVDKNFIGTIKNTNKLLDKQNAPFHIIGGKTGETTLAKQNLVIVTEAPCGGKIFNIILGSQNRFEDMGKLLQYINNSYDWSCPKS